MYVSGAVDTLSEIHPITHDQTYIVPSDVWNDDYIGEVHYLCTDSIFNDRDGDTYSFSISSSPLFTTTFTLSPF